jgi:urea transporter
MAAFQVNSPVLIFLVAILVGSISVWIGAMIGSVLAMLIGR